MIINRIGDWVVYLDVLAWALVLLYYNRVAKWWQHPEGRMIFFFAAGIFVILTYVAAVNIWHFVTLANWVRLAIFLGFLYMPVWQIKLIANAQNINHNRSRKHLKEDGNASRYQ